MTRYLGLGTVHDYLERANAAGIGWPLPEGLSEEELEAKLFGNQPSKPERCGSGRNPTGKPFMSNVALLLLLGFSPQVLAGLVFLMWLGSILEHCNLNWSFGPLRYVIVNPVYHRWHHTYPNEGGNKNFAGFFPFLDIIFGTFYMPDGQVPKVFGTERDEVPNGFVGQIVYPFLKSKPIE